MYKLNPFLRGFWTAEARHKVLFGGRASSKSHDAAGFAVYLAANYNLRFLCARKFQNKIKESVYALIKAKIEQSEYRDEFVITNISIKHKLTGSEFIFLGIARNLQEIRSLEGIDILWLEEANFLTPEEWEVIHPTIRAEDSQIWIIFNPGEVTDFAWQYFVVNPPHSTICKEINWPDNPFLSDTMLQVIHDEYKRDPKLAEHIYGGKPRTGSDKSVINLAYILSAVDAHKHEKYGWEPAGTNTVGYDVADDGDDLNGFVHMRGNVIMHAYDFEGLEDQLLKSCTRVYNEAVLLGASITFDCIGVGASAGNKFSELNESRGLHVAYDPFNAGSGVSDPKGVYMKLPHITILNKDHFANDKAKRWNEVAERFRKTHELVTGQAEHPRDECISINSATIPDNVLKKLQFELSAPHKDVDGNGRFKVESKKDMREKRGIKSGNIADAAVMAAIKPARDAAGFFDL